MYLEYNTRSDTTVYFTLTGEDLLPDEISAALGVLPDQSWKRGSAKQPNKPVPVSATLPVYKFGRWSLNAPCSKEEDDEYQIDQLLNLLERLPPILKSYVELYDGGIVVTFSSREVNIGIYLSSSIIQRMSELGLSIVYDIYPAIQEEEDDGIIS
jgi:hypothetical protein